MESKFTGTTSESIKINCFCSVMGVLSLGIAAPWLLCKKQRWYAKHTFIEGKQLVFDGKPRELIREYLLKLLFSYLSLGVYSFWLSLKLKKWIISHTHFKEVLPEKSVKKA